MTDNPVPGNNPAPLPPLMPQPRELDLFAFLLLLLRHIRFIAGCGAVAFLLMVANMLHTKPRYASTATMIIPQGNITSSTLSSQLSLSTVDLLGGGYELYGDIITSRSVLDRLIQDYDLIRVYHVKNLEIAEATLTAVTQVQTQREGLIRVTVQDSDRNRAADLANDYIKQLDILNGHLVLSSVGMEVAYLQREMVNEKNALADAEVALVEVQKNGNGLPPDVQASGAFNALETTRAELSADKIRLDALLTGDTEANPEVIRLRSQISGLTAQVDDLQRGQANTTNGTPTSALPEQTILYTRRQREVKFHETLFGLLESQYEQAKERQAKNPSIVQVLDSAVPSIHKAWPPRTYYCLMAGILGTIVGALLVSLRAVLQAYLGNPSNAAKLRQLKTFYRKQPQQV